jgi:large subunit ribosomal protein L15
MREESQIHLGNLQAPKGSRKERIRRARGIGSGLGKTAGRGGKGQTARTGKGRPKGFEGGQMPLYRRLPKFGFKSPFKIQYELVNLADIEKRFSAGSTVDPSALIESGLVKKKTGFIKVLGDGNLTKKLVVKAHRFSKTAIQKINQAGGTAEELNLPGEKSREVKVGGG